MSSFGGAQPATEEERGLRSISSKQYPFVNKDFVQNIAYLNMATDYLAKSLLVTQKGVDQANTDFLDQIQGILADVFNIIAGFKPTGWEDYGDLYYVLQGIGALFNINPDTPFPLNIVEIIGSIFSQAITPLPQFTDIIFEAIEAWTSSLGFSEEAIDSIKDFDTAVIQLYLDWTDLLGEVGKLVTDFFESILGFGSGNANFSGEISSVWNEISDAIANLVDGPHDAFLQVLSSIVIILFKSLTWVVKLVDPKTYISQTGLDYFGPEIAPAITNQTTVWSVGSNPNVQWVYDATTGYGDSKSFKTNGSGSTKRLLTEEFADCEPGDTFQISGYVKWTGVPATVNTFGPCIVFYSGNSEVVQYNVDMTSGHGTTGDFIQVSGNFIAPPNTDGYKIGCRCLSTLNSGTIWVSKISCLKKLPLSDSLGSLLNSFMPFKLFDNLLSGNLLGAAGPVNQFFQDILHLMGLPSGMGTGDPQVTDDISQIPLLGPVLQYLLDLPGELWNEVIGFVENLLSGNIGGAAGNVLNFFLELFGLGNVQGGIVGWLGEIGSWIMGLFGNPTGKSTGSILNTGTKLATKTVRSVDPGPLGSLSNFITGILDNPTGSSGGSIASQVSNWVTEQLTGKPINPLESLSFNDWNQISGLWTWENVGQGEVVRTQRTGVITIYSITPNTEDAIDAFKFYMEAQPTNPTPLNIDYFDFVVIPYTLAFLHPNQGIAQAIRTTIQMIKAKPGKFVLFGGSQGAEAISGVYDEIRGGELQDRNDDFLMGISIANPRRELGRSFPGCPSFCPDGHGMVLPNLEDTEDRWWEWSLPAGTYPTINGPHTYPYTDFVSCLGDDDISQLVREIVGIVGWQVTPISFNMIKAITAPLDTLTAAMEVYNGLLGDSPHADSFGLVQPMIASGVDPDDTRTFLQIAGDHLNDLGAEYVTEPMPEQLYEIEEFVLVNATPGQILPVQLSVRWYKLTASEISVSVRAYDEFGSYLSTVSSNKMTITNPVLSSDWIPLSGSFVMPDNTAYASVVTKVAARAGNVGVVAFKGFSTQTTKPTALDTVTSFAKDAVSIISPPAGGISLMDMATNAFSGASSSSTQVSTVFGTFDPLSIIKDIANLFLNPTGAGGGKFTPMVLGQPGSVTQGIWANIWETINCYGFTGDIFNAGEFLTGIFSNPTGISGGSLATRTVSTATSLITDPQSFLSRGVAGEAGSVATNLIDVFSNPTGASGGSIFDQLISLFSGTQGSGVDGIISIIQNAVGLAGNPTGASTTVIGYATDIYNRLWGNGGKGFALIVKMGGEVISSDYCSLVMDMMFGGGSDLLQGLITDITGIINFFGVPIGNVINFFGSPLHPGGASNSTLFQKATNSAASLVGLGDTTDTAGGLIGTVSNSLQDFLSMLGNPGGLGTGDVAVGLLHQIPLLFPMISGLIEGQVAVSVANLFGIINSGNIGATSATAVNALKPNFLVAQDFSTPETVVADENWSHDATDGAVTLGCAKVTCDGTQSELLSNEIEVAARENTTVACKVKWENLIYTGTAPFKFAVQKYRKLKNELGQTIYADLGSHDIDTIESPSLNSNGWQDLAEAYQVEPGVDQVRFCFGAKENALSGVVKFDEAEFLKIDLIADECVPGIGTTVDDIVTQLYGSAGEGFNHNQSALALANISAAVLGLTGRIAALEAQASAGSIAADDFHYSANEITESSNWDGDYSHSIDRGFYSVENGKAVWNRSTGHSQRGIFDWMGSDATSTTDYQLIQLVLDSPPISEGDSESWIYLCGRMSSDRSSYIRVGFSSEKHYSIGYVIAGSYTEIHSGNCAVPGRSSLLSLYCGVKSTSEPRRFKLQVGNNLICDVTEVGTGSPFGILNRRWGWGAFAEGQVVWFFFPSQGTPPNIVQWQGADQ